MSGNAQEIIHIANCSGFYGDRLSAAREMVEGGPIDVLTGDYLAELTMAILHGKRAQDPRSIDEATATLRIIAQSRDPNEVGRLFAAKVTELAIANYAGFYGRAPATTSGPVIEHWPALIDRRHIVERVHLNGQVSRLGLAQVGYQPAPFSPTPMPDGPTVRVPLGRIFGARSGDKGGAANVGVWAKTDEAYAFLHHFLTVERLKALLPDMEAYPTERYALPNIRAINFFIPGALGPGVAASTRTDGQAKSLGEYLRAKLVDVPEALLAP